MRPAAITARVPPLCLAIPEAVADDAGHQPGDHRDAAEPGVRADEGAGLRVHQLGRPGADLLQQRPGGHLAPDLPAEQAERGAAATAAANQATADHTDGRASASEDHTGSVAIGEIPPRFPARS